jgi:DNA-binding NtrC family response regulator
MNNQISVLIVDDDSAFRTILSLELRRAGFDVTTAACGEEALTILGEQMFDVALLDLKMPGMDGIAVLNEIKARSLPMEVVVLTGHGTVENAVTAMKMGAYDYLTKPCQLDEVEAAIRRAYEKQQLTRHNIALKAVLVKRDRFPELIGESKVMGEVLTLIERVAPTDSTVLVTGESGTGKELVARAIHRNSRRAKEPFVVIDCASLKEELLESELFGHEKGAYTGAVSLKHGLFEAADGGTVFLDEIGDITHGIQVKLLRVLEHGVFRRLGGMKDLRVDVRIIVATNRDLEQAVAEGKFREDLFYRLNVFPIHVPPLRERKEDIPLLIRHFALRAVSPDVVDLLVAYDWPGNVRELEHLIERAGILAEEGEIRPEHLPKKLRPTHQGWETENGRFLSLLDVEREYIIRVLKVVHGHRRKAAEILGISERHLYRMISEGLIPDVGKREKE